MTEREFLEIAAAVLKPEPAREIRLEDSDIDSLDLLALWCVLEERLGRPVLRRKFRPTTKLIDLYELVRR